MNYFDCIPFTESEWTEKKYTNADAVAAARIIVFDKIKSRELCVNAIGWGELDKPITLVELNHMSQRLVSDTLFYHC